VAEWTAKDLVECGFPLCRGVWPRHLRQLQRAAETEALASTADRVASRLAGNGLARLAAEADRLDGSRQRRAKIALLLMCSSKVANALPLIAGRRLRLKIRERGE